jgi:tetratricopeptide (TPR) repeat protein
MTLVRAEAAVDLAFTEPARARRIAEALIGGDDETVSVARHALGMASAAVGRLDDAERHLTEAISLAERAGLATRAAQARGSFSYVLTLTGRTSEALSELDRAQPAVSGVSAAGLRMQRALILTEIGRYDEAADGFAEALELLGGSDDLLEAKIRNNRSILRVQQRDWRGAEDDLRVAERLYTLSGHSGRTATVHHNRGLAAAARGDVPAALAAYDEAARRYQAAGRSPGLLPIERAEALLSVRLVAPARQAAEAAVVEFAREHNAVDLVQARLLLARAALADDDPATALAQAAKARRSARRQNRPGWAALADYLALRARWQAGVRATATLRAGNAVVEALTSTGWVVAALEARLIVARLALELGRTEQAKRELATVARAARTGPAELRARAWHAVALLRLSGGDSRGAQAALRAGMDVLAAFRDSLGASELRAHASGHAGELAATGLDLAVASRRPAAVLAWAERWRAGALRMRPVRPPDDAELAKDLEELRRVVVEQGRTTDQRSLLRRQSELEEAIRARARHATGMRAPDRVPSADRLSAALGQAALVEYVEAGERLYAVVLAGARPRLRELGSMSVVQREIEVLRFGLRHLAYEIGTARSLAAIADRVDHASALLDEALLAPLRAEIADRPLVVVPTGALHALPWRALPGCAGRPLTVAPSAALWHRAVTSTRTSSGRHVFAAGPGLDHAAPEVAALARRTPGASRFTGRRATVANVLAALDGAELGHIAAHGAFRADNPLFSQLRLADGPLTVYDLEQLTEPPRLVVLSACDTANSQVRPGDELLGLAAALLALGTRTLVASVVPVPDHASKRLMLRFHRLLANGRTPADALAAVQQGHSDMGFQCYGAG